MKNLLLILIVAAFMGCNVSKDQVAKILKENPEVLAEAIEANPAEFMEALQKAAGQAKESMAKKREEDEKKKFEESFNNPLKPVIKDDEVIRGQKGAPIVLIEYSDFECPFCSRGYETVNELLEKYKGKIKFVYKHLPLNFHPQAMISAQYFEAIAMQNVDKAWKFHDRIFQKQKELRNGEKFLKKIAKDLGVNMGKLAKDIKSETVKKRIEEDMAEAAKFGIQGTPGFVINGIPVKGAYPTSHFEMIIGKLKEKGKINI